MTAYSIHVLPSFLSSVCLCFGYFPPLLVALLLPPYIFWLSFYLSSVYCWDSDVIVRERKKERWKERRKMVVSILSGRGKIVRSWGHHQCWSMASQRDCMSPIVDKNYERVNERERETEMGQFRSKSSLEKLLVRPFLLSSSLSAFFYSLFCSLPLSQFLRLSVQERVLEVNWTESWLCTVVLRSFLFLFFFFFFFTHSLSFIRSLILVQKIWR